MIVYNNNNMRNPIIKDVGRGLRMLLLLYAIIHCLAAFVLHLVRMIFGTTIPTLFNILMIITCCAARGNVESLQKDLIIKLCIKSLGRG